MQSEDSKADFDKPYKERYIESAAGAALLMGIAAALGTATGAPIHDWPSIFALGVISMHFMTFASGYTIDLIAKRLTTDSAQDRSDSS